MGFLMRVQLRRAFLVVAVGLALAGCQTTSDVFGEAKPDMPGAEALAATEPDASGAEALAPLNKGLLDGGALASPSKSLLGSDPNDDLSLGKKQYRAKNFGLAENHFRHAVELHPLDAEAWLGLAASCDRLRRFDLADRAYAQAIKIVGPVPEILNNQGYSYMLRGDYKRARTILKSAQRKDPSNKYVLSNLQLLEESARTGKAIE
jgi:tetratricopeptide (TPR) repeat protein